MNCSDADKGTGECKLVSDYGPASTTAAGFIRSTNNNMTWWSAQNWCTAQGKTPVTRDLIGCSGVSNNYCTSGTLDAFKSVWGSGYVWLEDYGNDCRAWYVSYTGLVASNWNRYNYSNLFAVCLE